MTRKYILIDTMNTFFRSRHIVRGNDIDEKIGMAFHVLFSSINKSVRDFGGDHVVFCLEGKSWRKSVYPPYKRNRIADPDSMTDEQIEEDRAFMDAYSDFVQFIKENTNCTVLQHFNCEADDFIARWIQNHPCDDHIIISTDSDFYQLVSPSVSIYNGVTGHHVTLDGIFNDRGKPIVDAKTKEPKKLESPEWLLFEKCIRGDIGDNIFSAYPGVRKKGTKNKTGMIEAFEDRNQKGFSWNNFMLQRWVDHNGEEHKVLDDYNRNKQLIDLTQQPDDIKEAMDNVIIDAVKKEPISQVGIRFMKLCGKYNLEKLSEKANDHVIYLNKTYL